MSVLQTTKEAALAAERRVAEWLEPMELAIQPATLALMTALLMALLSLPWASWPLWLRAVLGVLSAAPASAVVWAAWRELRRHRTTWRPDNPRRTTALVTGGIYRRSRNPMYLGVLLFLLAWGCWLGNLGALVLLPLFFYLLLRLQIIPEERLLAEKFGERYRRYCRQTGRWW